MKERIYKVIVNISLILVLGLVYAGICGFTGFGIPCMFRIVTGFKCAGCGITHMFMALLAWDFEKAFYSNQFLFCMLPFSGIYTILLIARYVKNGKVQLRKSENRMCYFLIVLLVVWSIVRNLI